MNQECRTFGVLLFIAGCWGKKLLFACQHRSNKDDVWLRLWHFLDTMKQDANQSTNRWVAAHELSPQITTDSSQNCQ